MWDGPGLCVNCFNRDFGMSGYRTTRAPIWSGYRTTIWSQFGQGIEPQFSHNLAGVYRTTIWSQFGRGIEPKFGHNLVGVYRTTIWFTIWLGYRTTIWSQFGRAIEPQERHNEISELSPAHSSQTQITQPTNVFNPGNLVMKSEPTSDSIICYRTDCFILIYTS